MKKFRTYIYDVSRSYHLLKLFRIMKLSIILLVIATLQIFAEGAYAQHTELTVNLGDTHVGQVLTEIENQSEYNFLFNQKLVDTERRVNIRLSDKKIGEILDQVFSETNIDYVIMDRQVVLSPKEYLTEVKAALQPRKVSGTVTGPDQEPLIGVSIVIKGTTVGTITDVNGNYSLSDVPDDATLVFSFIGLISHEIVVGNQTVINLQMEVDAIGIEEVVAVGYGTRMKEELTGSISSLSGDKLEVSTSSSAMSRIQGQVSGVNVTTSNLPGGEATIRVRGLGTISDNDPLFVIDGVPVDPGTDLNPNDIESISILKDASSAAIYGTRGANGVVIITTKRGKENQKPRFNFTIRSGVKQAVNQYDLLNTSEFGELVFLEARNKGNTPGVDWSDPIFGNGSEPVIPDYILPSGAMEGDLGTSPDLYNYPDYTIIKANQEGTDWYDEIYRNGLYQEYGLSVSGGAQNMNYLFSGSYLSEDGYLDYTGFKRYNFRSNVDARINKRLKVGQSLQVSFRDQRGNRDDQGEATIISQAYRSQPIIPVYDIMGNYAGGKGLGTNSSNPVAMLDREQYNGGNYSRIIGNVYAKLNIIEGLDFTSTLGYNYGQWNGSARSLPNPEHAEPNFISTFGISNNSTFQWNWSNTLNYATTISDNQNLNIILGTEAVENKYQWHNAGRSQYFSVDPTYMQLSSGESTQTNEGSMSEWSLFSIFGRVNYDIMGKYRFEATARRDGSSRFGSENRYAIFPAASFAWSLGREDFMQGTKDVIDRLKIRLGWGMSGNDRIGNYVPYSTYATEPTLTSYPINGSNTSFVPGFAQATMGNPDVTWEKTETYNLGVDLRVFDNSLSLTTDVWYRYTSDMLYQLKVPYVLGNSTPPFVNIGEMKNIGFDIELGYTNTAFNDEFRYSVRANISRYVNEIVKLADDVEEEIIMGELRGMNYTRASAGHAFPEFYGYIVDGIFQTQEEADAHPSAIGEDGTYNTPGHFKYRDINDDGVIDADDRTYIGSPHPDFTGGLNIDLGYKNFDLNAFLYGSYGNEAVNYVRRWIDMGLYNGGRSKDALYNSWGSPYLDSNEDALLPIMDNETNSEQPSTFYLEDASFLRLKSLRLSYTIPENVFNRLNISNARIYLQVTNLFTITKYSGLDPEMNTTVAQMGLDQGALPTPRQIMLGINLGL
jgi:TonB-dependent starch-binding outer membrane protein SusC